MHIRSDSRLDEVQGPPRGSGLTGRLIDLIVRSRERSGRARHLQLIETLSLGGKRQLMLVKCNGEHFLVGAGAEGVQTIVGLRANKDGHGDVEFLSR